MKLKDITYSVIIAIFSFIIAYFAMTAWLGNPSEKQDTDSVKTTESISGEIKEPDPNIFNEDAINPTVQIEIGK